MKSSILNTARATIVAASLVITLGNACWGQEQNQTDVRLDQATSVSTKVSGQDLVDSRILNLDVFSTWQAPAPWCYTNYGRFPMVVALPPGAFCQVNVSYYPYVLTGVTGY
jgi:hypothetical protein